MDIGTRVQIGGRTGTVVSSQRIRYAGAIVHVRFDDGDEATLNKPELEAIDTTPAQAAERTN